MTSLSIIRGEEMKYILIILLLLPVYSFADSVMCGRSPSGFGCVGNYQAKNNNGVEVFRCSDGKKLLFSFNYCYIILDH